MDTMKRPRFEDITGHNDQDDGIYADALDEYSTKLERYADQLEEHYKSIELDNKILRNFEENVVRYGKSDELALKMAIGDFYKTLAFDEMIEAELKKECDK